VALILALLTTAICTPVVARLALTLGLVDRPGPLKVHQRPVAYLGGVAVLAGLAAPMAGARASLVLPLGLALLLGLADDLADLPAASRLVGEVGIGAITAVVLPGAWSWMGAAAVVVVVVALINAVNLLDGLDGLATSVGAIGALGYAVVLDSPGRQAALALAGALVGFLVWNRPPARIYLGDGGSYLIGTGLAMLLALTVSTHDAVAPSAGALLFVAVPVADTTVAIVRRRRAGRPLLVGDRGHIYDQLVDRGWSARRATVVCAAVQLVLVVIGVAAGTLSGPLAIGIASSVILVVGISLLWRFTAPSSWAP
jgi:UDP-GlcNAc:undecaprenyl-phosphate GlcNAc-1-phosphate transferase